MTYTPHVVIEAEKIVNATIGIADQEMTLPKLFIRQGFDQFKGAKDDTLTYRIPGRLVPRKYAFRNNRANPIVFDTYKEAITTITWGDRVYSGVKITDEQAEFDLDSPTCLQVVQGATVGRGLNTIMADAIEAAPYLFTIGGITNADGATAVRSATLEARKVLNKLGLPAAGRILVVGSNFEQAMLQEDKLILASVVGDAIASPALSDATNGKVNGFTVVTDQTIDADSAYALLPSSFVLITGAPYVPQSVGIGGTASYDGFAMRWMRDYDMEYLTDRSVVDTYAGVNYINDIWLNPQQDIDEVQDITTVTASVFVRGIKLTLDGSSTYPASNTYVGGETGLTSGWVNPIAVVTP